MACRDAALRNALRIERDHLKQFTVAFEFLLILPRRCDQGIQLTQLPVA